jgi:hypothetical protein
LQFVLKNNKPLEKQKEDLGQFQKRQGHATEIRTLYNTLLKNYCDYQNQNVKHNSLVKKEDVYFIVELTGIFIKHLHYVSEARK